MIRVKDAGIGRYEVTVAQRTSTVHTVSVSPEYYQVLSGGRIPCEKLIEMSFAFLLERESNTSILSSFDLPVIGRYFPEYERTIKNQIAGLSI